MSTTKIKVSNIASVTGTGNVVLSANPTFTGTTATANVSYTGTLTGSTGILNIGSGQLYKDASGNVGIGTSSPSTKLVVGSIATGTIDSTYKGNIKIEGTETTLESQGGLEFKTTSDGYGAKIQTLSGGGTNLVFANRNSSASWTERMRIDPSGNVGIGNTTPSSFDPTGKPLVVGSGSGNQGITIYAGTTGYSSVNFADGPTGTARYSGQVSYDHTNDALLFATNTGAERMRISSSGNLGIGTTNPTQKLHVMGSTIFDFTHGQNIKLGVSAGNNGNTTYSGDAYLYLWTSEPGVTWTGAGIGRNIVNTSNFPRVNTNLSGQMIRFDEGDSASISLITETKAGTRYIPLSVTDGNVFINSGNLMIGATSSVNTNTKIYAVTAGQDDNNGIIQAYNTNSAAGNSASLMTRSYWGTGQFMSWASNGMRIGMRSVVNGGSAAVYYTYANDNIGFGNNSALGTGVLYTNGGLLTNTNPSDARLKTDIQDITLGLDFISQLKPVSYKWLNNRANQDTQYGFIAQDVQEIEPSLVREFESAVDIDSENSDDHKTVTRLGLEEKGIYTAMVKAIQELKTIIDTQQEQLNIQQQQINTLLGK